MSFYTEEERKIIESSKLAFTGLYNGLPVMSGGIHPINKNDGIIWIQLSQWCQIHKIATVRWLRDMLEIAKESFSFKRFVAAIRPDYQSGRRLAERLGFKKKKKRKGFMIYEMKLCH